VSSPWPQSIRWKTFRSRQPCELLQDNHLFPSFRRKGHIAVLSRIRVCSVPPVVALKCLVPPRLPVSDAATAILTDNNGSSSIIDIARFAQEQSTSRPLSIESCLDLPSGLDKLHTFRQELRVRQQKTRGKRRMMCWRLTVGQSQTDWECLCSNLPTRPCLSVKQITPSPVAYFAYYM
jgi:hypothetical protein